MKQKKIWRHRGFQYATAGLSLVVVAPAFWAIIRIAFLSDPNDTLLSRIMGEPASYFENILLYCYIGMGAAAIASVSGFILGKSGDELRERARELEELHRAGVSQAELFENRCRVLDGTIKEFHRISSRIQRSLDVKEVISLCAEGLHDVLGFERVNILMADSERKKLQFLVANGSPGFEPDEVSLPLDSRIGIIFKSFSERKQYLIDDISKCPPEYCLRPPFDGIKPLRSRSFYLCPIVVKGESVGILGIDNAYSRRNTNESDGDTIRLFADQAALAINRINLLKAINVLATEMENTFSGFIEKRKFFSKAVHSLKSAIDSLFTGAGKISRASENVMNTVEETSSAAGQISVSIDQVTNNLNFLAESIEKSVSAMEEIHASIKNVEKNAAVSHEVSRQVTLNADEGREKVEETIAALAEIQKSVELTFEGIMRLAENSGRIGSIVNVIRDITKKTNLLALNASIIAAQAGEFGKDFGVVAEEMRSLSHQTGQITGEISVIISYILNDSDTAAKNITFSKELVGKGVEIGHKTGETLKIINERAVHSMEMTEEIKSATEEQVRGVKLVTQSIEDVSTMASQIYNASKEQSEATKNILRSIESIKDMAINMVKATEAQLKDGSDIEQSVNSHIKTTEEIFDSMEQRRNQSIAVIEEMENIKGVSL